MDDFNEFDGLNEFHEFDSLEERLERVDEELLEVMHESLKEPLGEKLEEPFDDSNFEAKMEIMGEPPIDDFVDAKSAHLKFEDKAKQIEELLEYDQLEGLSAEEIADKFGDRLDEMRIDEMVDAQIEDAKFRKDGMVEPMDLDLRANVDGLKDYLEPHGRSEEYVGKYYGKGGFEPSSKRIESYEVVENLVSEVRGEVPNVPQHMQRVKRFHVPFREKKGRFERYNPATGYNPRKTYR